MREVAVNFDRLSDSQIVKQKRPNNKPEKQFMTMLHSIRAKPDLCKIFTGYSTELLMKPFVWSRSSYIVDFYILFKTRKISHDVKLDNLCKLTDEEDMEETRSTVGRLWYSKRIMSGRRHQLKYINYFQSFFELINTLVVVIRILNDLQIRLCQWDKTGWGMIHHRKFRACVAGIILWSWCPPDQIY